VSFILLRKKKKGVEEIQLKARRLILDKARRGDLYSLFLAALSHCLPPTIILCYRLKTRSKLHGNAAQVTEGFRV
jgi:hypothetical protein